MIAWRDAWVWFSIAHGAVELMAPRAVERLLGMKGREKLVRTFGAREISAGIVSLSTERQAGMWSRVAGDGMGLAALLGGTNRSGAMSGWQSELLDDNQRTYTQAP